MLGRPGHETALAAAHGARAGKPTDRPNIVMGINVQICWEKFANYWDVEARLVPMEGDRFHAVRGGGGQARATRTPSASSPSSGPPSTAATSRSPTSAPRWTSSSERTGIDIPVHVDGASGAMIAPFCDPDLEWDFRLPRVASINTSGHKYGLVYPGVGWIVWRDERGAARGAGVPGELPRRRHADVRAELLPARARRSSPSTTTSCGWGSTATGGCSRPAGTWRPGWPAEIGKLGPFRLLTERHQLPVFAFTLAEDVTRYSVFDVSAGLRQARVAGAGLHVPGRTGPTWQRCASWCATASPGTWRSCCWTTCAGRCPCWSAWTGRCTVRSRPASTTASIADGVLTGTRSPWHEVSIDLKPKDLGPTGNMGLATSRAGSVAGQAWTSTTCPLWSGGRPAPCRTSRVLMTSSATPAPNRPPAPSPAIRTRRRPAGRSPRPSA